MLQVPCEPRVHLELFELFDRRVEPLLFVVYYHARSNSPMRAAVSNVPATAFLIIDDERTLLLLVHSFMSSPLRAE